MEKTVFRCIAHRKLGRICNRLLGKGQVAEFEIVCPKCGATLLLTESGVKVTKTAKH